MRVSVKLILIFVAVFQSVGATVVSDSLLKELDKILPMRDAFSDERRKTIIELTAELQKNISDEDRYNIYRGLYGAYRYYRNDSALDIAAQRLALAKKIGLTDKIISASINLADAYSSCGNYYSAIETLDTLDRSVMQPHQLKYLYSVYGSTFSRLADNETVNSGKIDMNNRVKTYRDSSCLMFSNDDAELYYLKVWQLMDNSYWNEANELMERTRSRFGDDLSNPSLLTQRAIIYHNLGLQKLEKECLARAAIIDISKGSKDYSALMSLSLLLNNEGDIDRAYDYITYALEDASFSNARSRINQVLRLIPIVYQTYERAEEHRHKTAVVCVILLALLTVALVLSLLSMRRQLSRNSKMRAALDEKNKELNRTVELLNRANNVQRADINELFDAYSRFINRMTMFRKNIMRLLKVSKYREASELVESNKIEADELKELYARFDKMFLISFPEFIKQFNTFVREEDRVDENLTSLTSLLRVVAVMKLGITSTKQIEAMLHYTSQTVYNYKNRIKGGLIVPTEVFEEWLSAQ